MKKIHCSWLAFLFLFCTLAFAAPFFPELTGRVVDNAHVLSEGTIQQLDTILADYERGTTNQVVVVTIPSLQGYAIEDYGYQLGRHWEIGQAGKNNGVLLIVAPNEKKVRIEVGYGLEPVLTDALSSTIIQGIILPEFRAGNLETGVVKGTRAIVDVLGGKSISSATPPHDFLSLLKLIGAIIFLIIFYGGRFYLMFAGPISFTSSRGGSGFGGGFSGGGGSFGGGGASGSW